MKIVVAGGTGYIGSRLCEMLVADGHDVVILSRTQRAVRALAGTRTVRWDGRTSGPWAGEIDGADTVVNLAGEPIAPGRWTNQRKLLLRSSRIDPTRTLVTAIGSAASPPAVFVNASAVGYYGNRGGEEVTEDGPPGSDFLAHLTVDWEEAAKPAEAAGVRVVLLRQGVVLGPDAPALRLAALPFRFLLGGPMGSGHQWISWIHIDDLAGIFRLALGNPAATGPLNATSPQPVTNRIFSQMIGRALGRPSWITVPAPVLRLALGELSETLLTGQRVVPALAARLGYQFRWPHVSAALQDAL